MSHINQLNALLRILSIPTTLSHPSQLTPSLSFQVLQALFPNLPAIKCSSALDEAKLFLGTLQTDVLPMFTGAETVDNVDTRRFAQGRKRECIFIAEVLCWISRRVMVASSVHHCDTNTTTMSTAPSGLSFENDVFTDTTLTVPSMTGWSESSQRGIRVPVRYTGCINHADEEEELRSFQASRRHVGRGFMPENVSTPSRRHPVLDDSWDYELLHTPPIKHGASHGSTTTHLSDSSSTRRSALYTERAKILDNIAALVRGQG